MAAGGDLKYVAFVPRAAESGVKVANTAVNAVNDNLPASIKPTVVAVEERISTTVAPVISSLTEKSAGMLQAVDNKLDAAVSTASVVLEKQKEFHAQNLEQYKAAREAYLKKIEQLVEFLRKNGVSGTAQVLVDAVKAQAEKVRALPSHLADGARAALDGLAAAYHKLLASPQVQALVEKAQPAAKAVWGRYMGVHDYVVANGLYRFSYDKASSVLSYASSTSLAQSLGARVQPWAAPYTGPLVEAGYYQALLDHVKPATM